MDNRNTKIHIFSNSDRLLEFLKTKQIYNYTYSFEPFKSVEKNEKNSIGKKNQVDDFKGIILREINVLVVDTDLLLAEDDSIFYKFEGKTFREMAKLYEESGSWKWLYESELRGRYDFVVLYGRHQPIYSKDFDIHFNSFDILKDFFEVFYYLFNGVDYFSIDINEIIYSFGTRPYGLKCFTFGKTKEVLSFIEEYNAEMNSVVYIKKSTLDGFDFNLFLKELNKLDQALSRKGEENIPFYFTAVLNGENDECWEKLFVI